MPTFANKDIREEIEKARLYHWEVAQEMGIMDTNFSRMMRTELSEAKKIEILKAIKRIKEKRNREEI